MMFLTSFECVRCGWSIAAAQAARTFGCPECGSVLLDALYDYARIRETVSRAMLERRGPLVLEAWRELLPVEPEEIPRVTLGERATFLVPAPRLAEELGVRQLYLKDETAHATGAFKDRSMPVAMAAAVRSRADTVVIVSTGNAAAAAAAYAARAGLKCVVMVPAGTSQGKLSQAAAYGAAVVQIEGTFDDIVGVYRQGCQEYGWYPVGIGNMFRWEGDKTAAYEVARQGDWVVPDRVVVPAGSGQALSRIWKGFEELKVLGWTTRVPKMVAVQSAQTNALERAFRSGLEEVPPVVAGPTIAGGIAVGNPLEFGIVALRAVYGTGGTVLSLSEQEIADSWKTLASRAGVFAEPAGAVGIGGLRKLAAAGELGADERVVCVVTGHGLKDVDYARGATGPPPTVKADFERVRAAIDRSQHT